MPEARVCGTVAAIRREYPGSRDGSVVQAMTERRSRAVASGPGKGNPLQRKKFIPLDKAWAEPPFKFIPTRSNSFDSNLSGTWVSSPRNAGLSNHSSTADCRWNGLTQILKLADKAIGTDNAFLCYRQVASTAVAWRAWLHVSPSIGQNRAA